MPRGEVPFFESPTYERQEISVLEELFQRRTEEQRGIRRPNYLGHSEVPARIVEHLGKVRLIAILRDPVARAVSAYFHYRRFGFIPQSSVDYGIAQLLDGAYQERFSRSGEILDYGCYYQHLQNYLRHVDRKQILILLHEDVVADRLKAVRCVYSFLGIDPSYVSENIEAKPQSAIYHSFRLRMLALRRPLLYRRETDGSLTYRGGPRRVGQLAANAITWFDRAVLARCLHSTKPILAADVTERLFEYYREDIDQLETLLDRNLNHWRLASHR